MTKPHYYVPQAPNHNRVIQRDLCIYGGSSGGIAAATSASRLGLSVVVLEPGAYVGGLTAGGLGCTDIGNKHAIGGLAREFYRRVGACYGMPECWLFEPHVAGKVFHDWIAEEKIEVLFGSFLARVELQKNRITRIWTENGLEVAARVFIDCSYEGDLMAGAKVSFTVGRESNSQYGETLNGAQVHETNQFELPVDPYRTEGDPSSGLLPGIDDDAVVTGMGDRRVQAYNFRLCLTKSAANRLPITKPIDYDRSRYELLARYLHAGYAPKFTKFDMLVNDKADVNNDGGFSTDYIGFNHSFPEASYREREVIFQGHVSHIKGLLWFYAQDAEVPSAFQESFRQWGWSRDEFIDHGGFSHALYVREARRMIGDVVLTEHHCTGDRTEEDVIALAAYTMDSHNCRRIVREGRVLNEGDVQVPCGPPYPISYRAVVPRRGECENLFVPFCLSASHIAFGSIRMEPVFMILGESCAHAALAAIRSEVPVQDVPHDDLRTGLEAANQVLKPVPGVGNSQLGE